MHPLISKHEYILDDQCNPDNKLSFNVPKSLKTTHWRWLALLLINIMLAGECYCYDTPQALQEPIQDDLNVNAEEFISLYSVYILPNIILPLLGSRIIYIVGIHKAGLFFASLVAIGQILVAIAGYTSSYYVLLFGRAIFGLGGDCMTVTVTFYIAKWFTGAEIAFAYSFIDVTNNGLTALNSWLSPKFYAEYLNLGFALLIGAIISLISLISTICMVYLDKYDEKYVNTENMVPSNLSLKESLNPKKLFDFPILLWLIVLNYGIQSASAFGFTSVQNDYIATRYAFDPQKAGSLIAMLVYGISGVLPPLWGKLMDKCGNRALFTLVAALFVFTGNLILLFSKDCIDICYWPIPIIPLLLIGLFLSGSDSVTYPTFSVFLPMDKLATAYSWALVFQNIMTFFGQIVVGWILDNSENYDQGYVYVSLFLLLVSLVGIGIIFCIFIFDAKKGGRLVKVYKLNDSVNSETNDIIKGINPE